MNVKHSGVHAFSFEAWIPGFLDSWMHGGASILCTVSCVRWRIGGGSEPCHPHTHGLGPYMMGRFVARKKKVTITEVSGFNLYLAMGRDLVESVE